MSSDEDVTFREIESATEHSVFNRRTFLAASLTYGLAAITNARLGATNPSRPLTIAFGWVPNCEYADIFVGMERGTSPMRVSRSNISAEGQMLRCR